MLALNPKTQGVDGHSGGAVHVAPGAKSSTGGETARDGGAFTDAVGATDVATDAPAATGVAADALEATDATRKSAVWGTAH